MCEGLGGRKESGVYQRQKQMATVQGRKRTVNGKSAVAKIAQGLERHGGILTLC